MRRFNQGIVLTGVGLTLCLWGCLRDRLNPYDPLGGSVADTEASGTRSARRGAGFGG